MIHYRLTCAAKRITASGSRSSSEEGSTNYASMVKACIIPQPKGSNFMNSMACNSNVKKAAYHLLELSKLLAGSNVNWEHSKPHGSLLHGPLGISETSLPEAMAFDAQYTFFKVLGSLIRSCLVGNAETLDEAIGSRFTIMLHKLTERSCQRNSSSYAGIGSKAETGSNFSDYLRA